MGALYGGTAVTGYNANPPPDDGTTVPTNLITWAGIKQKIGDPLNTFAAAIDSNLTAAFGKTLDGAGVVSTGVNYAMTGADQGRLIYATASAITITTPDAGTVNAPFVFAVLNNTTGNITLAGNATNTQTVDGTTTVTIPAGAGAVIKTDGTNWWTYGQNWTNAQVEPQGRLTLVSGTPVMAADETAQTTVYYTPYKGDLLSIPNGTKNVTFAFSEISLALVSNHLADTLYDVFVFLDPADNTTIRLGTGPAWATTTAGSGARGSGAGTTQLSRLNGLWTNTVAITLRNGSSTYSVALKAALYVGTIYIDHTAGQVSAHLSWGQNRKYGIWNAYNRKPIILVAGNSTSSWSYATNTLRASDNAPSSWSSAVFNVGSGTACNGLTTLNGLPEEYAQISFTQQFEQTAGSTATQAVAIGYNSTSVASGTSGSTGSVSASFLTIPASYDAPPSLGINTVSSLEKSSGGTTFEGTQTNMNLRAEWMG